MDTVTPPADTQRPSIDPERPAPEVEALSRRTLLRVAGGGARGGRRRRVCSGRRQQGDVDVPAGQYQRARPVCRSEWVRSPIRVSIGRCVRRAVDEPRSVGVTASPSAPAMDHDANAKAVVDRFLGGEGGHAAGHRQPAARSRRSSTGSRSSTSRSRRSSTRSTPQKDPIDALGFNGTWPGPRLTVVEGDQGPGDLHEQHARVDRDPFPRPGRAEQHGRRARTSPRTRSSRATSFTYEFTAKTAGSHMYHSPPQRDRPGRAGAARARSSSSRRTPPQRYASSTARPRTSSGSATTRSAASRSTAAASRRPHRSSRSSARRSSSGS